MKPSTKQAPRNPIVEEYSRLAADYERKWSFYINATARATLARLELADTDRLLDVGCGTGVLLYYMSQSHPTVQLCGLDPVTEMLRIARNRLPPSVKLCAGWAEHLPIASEQFDLVLSCNMFHYIHQPGAALREMMRVLRPGGKLVITDWCDDYLACHICDWYLRLFDQAHFKVYGTRECARLLQDHGYSDVHVERYKLNWLWGLMTARGGRHTST